MVRWCGLDLRKSEADSREHGNKPSGSIKGVKFLDKLSDYQLFTKGSAALT